MGTLIDNLIDLFEKNLTASILIIILLLVGLVFLVWWSAKVYFNLKNKPCEEHKKKIENLPCEFHKEKINQIDVLSAKFDVVMQTMQILTQTIRSSSSENKLPIIQSRSPISLTDYGKELSIELEMDKNISENWSVISKFIDENSKSMNPYDIQQFCINYIIVSPDEVLSKEGNDKVKSKAFSLGIAVFDLYQAAAIIIRDRYFYEHNIDLGDIDNNAPNKNQTL